MDGISWSNEGNVCVFALRTSQIKATTCTTTDVLGKYSKWPFPEYELKRTRFSESNAIYHKIGAARSAKKRQHLSARIYEFKIMKALMYK
jgi:hypothetical protein